MKVRKIDRLLGDTKKCCDCGKDFYPNKGEASDIRGPDCNQKFMLKSIKQLEQVKLEYADFISANPTMKTMGPNNNGSLLNDLFAGDPELDMFLHIDNITSAPIFKLQEQLREDSISFNELYQHTFSPNTAIKELSITYFYHKYCKTIDPEFVTTLQDEVKYKFASSFETTLLTLDYLSEDKNKKIANEAKRTLSIIKKKNSKSCGGK